MIDSRVITTAVFPNPRKLGYDVQASIGISVEPGYVESVAHTLRDMHEIAFVSLMLGRVDLLIYAVTPSMREMTELVTQKVAVIPGVRETETSVSAHVFKAFANWRVPLDELNRTNHESDEDLEYFERQSAF